MSSFPRPPPRSFQRPPPPHGNTSRPTPPPPPGTPAVDSRSRFSQPPPPPANSSNSTTLPASLQSPARTQLNPPRFSAPPPPPGMMRVGGGPPSAAMASSGGSARGIPAPPPPAAKRTQPPPPPPPGMRIPPPAQNTRPMPTGTMRPPPPGMARPHPPAPPPVMPNGSASTGHSIPHPPMDASIRSHESRRSYPQQPPVVERPRIDPSQIPKPPSFTTSHEYPYCPKQQMGIPPPLANTRYSVLDDGNASPEMLRSTVYTIPKDRSVWHQTGDLPLAIVCSPLAIPPSDNNLMAVTVEDEIIYRSSPQAVPVITSSPQRCTTCHAYPVASSFGVCPLCQARMKGNSTTELGTVEYAVDGAYCTRHRPVQPVHLYALDLTHPHVKEYVGILRGVVEEIRKQYYQQWGIAPVVGVCLVSCAGILVRSKHDDRYLVAADLSEDPFSPVPLNHWCYNVYEEWESLLAFLDDQLPNELQHWVKTTAKFRTPTTQQDGLDVSCGGAALAFLADALSDSGGRGTWISGRRPNYGVGKFTNPSSSVSPLQLWDDFNTPQEQATAEFYKKLAKQCCKDRVALSVVYQTNESTVTQSLDIATIGELCRATCGNLSWILKGEWKRTVHNELIREALALTGWDAVFKVRCSTGLVVKTFLGSKGNVVETMMESELEMSCVNHRTCICVELEHRVGGISKDIAYLQTALLYTNHAGQRRVRVSTIAVKVGLTPQDVYRSVDFSAQSSLLMRGVVDYFRKPGSDARQKAHDFLYHRTIQMLAAYRKCSSTPATQLVLPERMQLLPLFTMSLLKSPMVRSNVRGMPISVTSDERSYYAWHANQVLPAYPVLLVYPNIYRVEFQEPEFTEDQKGSFLVMPDADPPSMESLQDDCTYLLDDGLRLYLLHGSAVTRDSRDAVARNPLLPHLLRQLRLFASNIDTRPTAAPLTNVEHEDIVYPLMVADAGAGEKDYTDFLVSLHKQIRENAK